MAVARATWITLTIVLGFLPLVSAQYTPDQIHVSISGTAADGAAQPMDAPLMVFHWSVAQPYSPAQMPRLKYSVNGGAEQTAPATLVGVARDTSPPTAREEHDVLPVYAAKIRAPIAANITYSVGEGTTFSPPATIKTMPKPTEAATLVALSHIGYQGYSRLTGQRDPAADPRAEPTIRAALNQSPDVALLVGQLGYSSSSKPWSAFMRSTQPLQSTVISVPVPGDAETPDGHHQIRERYVMPHVQATAGSAGGETELLYHGFAVGPVYVIGLDSSSICTTSPGGPTVPPCSAGVPNQVQTTWLHDALEDLREDYKANWIIVYVNHGPYMYADDGDDVAVRQLWTPLFETYNVDLVIHSNEAIYQRTHPLRNQVPLATGNRLPAGLGPVYVTTGTAGYANPIHPTTDLPPDWIARIGYDGFTFLRLDATNRTLRVSAIEAANGTVIDAFLLDKDIRPSHLPATSEAPSPGPRRSTSAPEAGLVAVSLLGFILYRRRREA